MDIVIPDFVVVAERGPGGVIVNSLSGEEYGLDPRELALWRVLASAGKLEAAMEVMRGRHGVEKEAFVDEVNALLSRFGPLGLIKLAGAPAAKKKDRLAVRIGNRMRELREWAGWWLDARFDRRHGTDTTGQIKRTELYLDGASARDAVYYEATPTRVIRRALRVAVPDPERYVFVDYGSGKGRVLLLASHYPFKRVIGVELSGILHITAQHNIRVYRGRGRRCADVRSVCCDAARFELPDDDLVLYFYTPFVGNVFDKVLENIRAWHERGSRRLIVVAYSSRSDQIRAITGQPFVRQRREIPLPYEFTRIAQRRLYIFTNF